MDFNLSRTAKEYWNGEAENFDAIYNEDGSVRGPLNKLLRSDMEGRYRFARTHARLDSRPRILEAGCGTGIHIKGYLEGGASFVTGVDLSHAMLTIAAQRLEGYGDRVALIEGDFMELEFDAPFDVVTALGVFDYVAEPLDFLRKAMSLAKDAFIATFPRSGTLRSCLRRARLSLKGRPVYFYSEEKLRDMAEACGARINRHEIIGQLHCVVLTQNK
jgi:2-polyprenyl-3-methyl-5-hydroxy-6-metoxy-1,4-benzoquinol methylase